MPVRTTRQEPADPQVRPPRPLLTAAARPLAATVVVACLAVTALLGALVWHQTQAGWLDGSVDLRVRAAAGGHWRLLDFVVLFGRSAQVTVMAAVLTLACVAARRWRGAVLVAIAVPAAGALTEFLLKPLFGRLLSGQLSYPSGHTTGVIALAVTFAVLLADPSRPRLPAAVRLLLAALAFLAAGAVAVAVVALGLHYFTDTIGGAATGTAVVLLTALSIDSAAGWLHRAHRRGSRAKSAADAPTTGAPLASYLSRDA